MANKGLQGQERGPGGSRGEAERASGRGETRAPEPQRGLERREPQLGLERGWRSLGMGLSPFGVMRRMMEDMDRFFEDFGLGAGRALGDIAFSPQVEVFEQDGKLVVRADLPGLKKEDVRVNLDESGLLIEGERKSEHEERREGYYHSERSYGSFQRRIPIPRGVDVSSCDASFDNGVLEVTLELPKESRRTIEVKSGGGTSAKGSTVQH